jgi:hypothetical protein
MWHRDAYVALIHGKAVPVLSIDGDVDGATAFLADGETACPPCSSAGYHATPWTVSTAYNGNEMVRCDSCREEYPLLRVKDLEAAKNFNRIKQGLD